MAKVIITTSFVLAFVAQAADAQNRASPVQSSGSADQEIIVTARKVGENIQKVPISITALNGAALANASVHTTNDLQNQVPNLYIQKSSNDPQAFYVSMRGQKQGDLPLTLDPSIGIYIDGLYLPRTYGLANALVDLNRVEVLRGPQGTLYGRNTTGGAISFYSQDPVDKLGGSVDISGGNYGYWNLVGVLNVPLSDDVGLRVVGQRGEHNGYGHDAVGRDLDDDDSTYLRAKLKAHLTNTLTAVLTGSYSHDKTGGLLLKLSGLAQGSPPGGVTTVEAAAENGNLTPAGMAAAANQLSSYVGGNFYRSAGTAPGMSRFTGENVGLDLKQDFGSSVSVRSITGYEHFRRAAGGDTDGTPFDIVTYDAGTYDRYISEELQVLGKAGAFSWVAGLYGGDERGKEFTNNSILGAISSGNPNRYIAGVRNRTGAAFAQANWSLSQSWRLTGGIRYSADRREVIAASTAGPDLVCVVPAPGVELTPPGASQCPRLFKHTYSKPSWLASVDHDITANILGYAKVSYGYRTGGINFRGSNTEETFAAFKPETVTEYEVGLKSELFDRRLRINIAAYHDDYSNIQRSISVATLTGAPATIVTNAAKAKINGFEAEGVLRLTRNFTLNGSAGLTDAKYKKFQDLTGDRSGEHFDVPKWTATAGARVTQPTSVGELAAQVDTHWQSRVYLVPSAPTLSQVTQNNYALLDARISLNIDKANMQIAFYGKNLTAKKYAASAISLEAALGYNYIVPGDPRTFGIEVTMHFNGI